MCRELASEVGKLMSSSFVFLKKKAALACIKIVKKCPELRETFIYHLHSYFEYKNHGVLLAGCALANEIFKADPSQVKKFIKYTSVFTRHLKNLISSNYSSDFDVNGVTDPFLQCQILCILKHFGAGNKEISEEMKDIISDISTTAESSKLTSNAVQYELVKTIIGIDSDTSMKALASNILGKLLQSKDNNYKYIALNTMREVIRTDLSSVQKHRSIILECLKDTDISICRRALELSYLIINSSNVKQIVKELLNFILIAADEFKLELTTRITQCIVNYGTSVTWQIDNLIKILCMSGNFFSEDSVSSIINLIISNEELKLYAVHKLFLGLKNYVEQEALAKVAVYIIGEYGNFLVSNSVIGPEDEQIIVTETEVITLLRKVGNNDYSNSSVCEFLMNCYLKLTTKFSQDSSKLIKQFLNQETNSFYFEVQQRAVEYAAFDQVVTESLKKQLTNNIPIAKTHNKRLDVAIQDYNENSEKPTEIDQRLYIKYSNSFKEDKIYTDNNRLISNPIQSKNLNLLDDLNTLFIGNPAGGANTINMSQHNNLNSVFPDIMQFSQLPTNNSNKISSSQNTNQYDLLSGLVNNYNLNDRLIGNQPIDLAKSSLGNMGILSNNPLNFAKLKQFYGNQYFTLNYTSNLNEDGSYSGFFYVSNVSNQFLLNFNLKFMVLSFLTFKVVSTLGNSLEPFQSQGIIKVRRKFFI